MNALDVVGWVGATSLALCGLPQAIKSWKEGHAKGIAHGMVLLWLLGEGAMLTYAGIKYTSDFALLANYIVNALVVVVIAKYKYFPRKNTHVN